MEFQYAENEWYRSTIDRKTLKALSRRSDRPGLVYFGSYMALIVATGALATLSWGTWWALPAFALYGTLYGFCEVPAHECAHGTPFRSRWLNEAVFWVAGFMSYREPVYSRSMHAPHHTHTLITGRDPEIDLPRPANLWKLAADFVRLPFAAEFLGVIVLHSLGIVSKGAREFVSEGEHARMTRNSRVLFVAYAAVFAWAIASWSWLPLMLLFFPRMYGAWLHELLAKAQDGGLAVDVRDHRRNSRTVLMGPVLRFLYWNMNYHIEHHLFPSVPFHALPKAHEAVAAQMPPTVRGVWGAWREMAPVFLRQQREPDFHIEQALPEPAAS